MNDIILYDKNRDVHLSRTTDKNNIGKDEYCIENGIIYLSDYYLGLETSLEYEYVCCGLTIAIPLSNIFRRK